MKNKDMHWSINIKRSMKLRLTQCSSKFAMTNLVILQALFAFITCLSQYAVDIT